MRLLLLLLLLYMNFGLGKYVNLTLLLTSEVDSLTGGRPQTTKISPPCTGLLHSIHAICSCVLIETSFLHALGCIKWPLQCVKILCGWGSTLDSAEGAYDAPQGQTHSRLGSGYPSPHPTPSAHVEPRMSYNVLLQAVVFPHGLGTRKSGLLNDFLF